MTVHVSVTVPFEMAHRLPNLGGKCASLHGHSWNVTGTVTADSPADNGIVLDFGSLKTRFRAWVDANLDHGVALGPEDPLVPVLRDYGTKVFLVRPWPTVEAVAALLGAVVSDIVDTLPKATGARLTSITVRETPTNTVTWEP